ncbi:restriction endonuclease subunit R [Planctomycetota bacterium]
MSDNLEGLLARLRESKSLFLSSEEATKQGAILPILAKLGWDRDNIQEVIPEYSVASGRVDYCLKTGEQSVFLEVKRANEALERHQEQLLDYAFRQGVKLAILTNGLLWWFYLPLSEGSWEQRKFFTVDIEQQKVLVATAHFRQFLQKEAVSSGSAVKDAEKMREGKQRESIIQRTIPKAWKQLCEEPDEMLLELFAEKVESLCGHSPDLQMLAEYLVRPLRTDTIVTTKPLMRTPGLKTPTKLRRGYTGKFPIAYRFEGERCPVRSFKNILMGLCEALYGKHGTEFERVFNLRGRKREHFSRDYRNMTDPKEIVDSGIYVETNLSANGIIGRCYQLLDLFDYHKNVLEIEFRDD